MAARRKITVFILVFGVFLSTFFALVYARTTVMLNDIDVSQTILLESYAGGLALPTEPVPLGFSAMIQEDAVYNRQNSTITFHSLEGSMFSSLSVYLQQAGGDTLLGVSHSAAKSLPAGEYRGSIVIEDGTYTLTLHDVVLRVLAVPPTDSRVDGVSLSGGDELYDYEYSKEYDSAGSWPNDLVMAGGGSILLVPRAEYFVDQHGNNYADMVKREYLARSDQRDARISLVVKYNRGRNLLKNISLVEQSGILAIKIEFRKAYNYVEEQPFEYCVGLAIDGRPIPEADYTVCGVVSFDTIQPSPQDEYIDLSFGDVVAPSQFMPGVTLDLGNGVTISRDLFSGKKYRGYASNSMGETEELIAQYNPGLIGAYTLAGVNINSASSEVRIDAGSSSLYVYGENGAYLGTTQDALPYSRKYYLCTTQSDSLVDPGLAAQQAGTASVQPQETVPDGPPTYVPTPPEYLQPWA